MRLGGSDTGQEAEGDTGRAGEKNNLVKRLSKTHSTTGDARTSHLWVVPS